MTNSRADPRAHALHSGLGGKPAQMLHKTRFLGGKTLPGDEDENQQELPTLGMALPKIIHLLKLPHNLDDSVSGTQL